MIVVKRKKIDKKKRKEKSLIDIFDFLSIVNDFALIDNYRFF